MAQRLREGFLSTNALWLLIPGLPLAFAATWLVVVRVIAWAGGWRALAQAFPEAAAPDWRGGDLFFWRSAYLGRFTRYRRCLGVAVDEAGVRLRPAWAFRPFHPALFLPWEAISALEIRRFMAMKYGRIVLGAPAAERFEIVLAGDPLVESLARFAPAERTRRLD